MDSSISHRNDVQYILGEKPRIPARQLNFADLLKILERMLRDARGLLKYLPNFKPLAELLNSSKSGLRRITNVGIVRFPSGFSEKSKVVSVMNRITQDEYPVRAEKSLILTDDGALLLWTASYKVEVVVPGFKIDLYAETSYFELLYKDGLSVPAKSPQLWEPLDQSGAIIQALKLLETLAEAGVRERKERLASIEWFHARLTSVLNRIDWMP
jgi:hypothetical protein